MSFVPIRIVGLDTVASIVHPIARNKSNRATAEPVTLHFALSEEVSADWAKHFKECRDNSGESSSVKAHGKFIALEAVMRSTINQTEYDLQVLKTQVNSANLAYERQLNLEAQEEERKQGHYVTLREMANKLKFD